MAWTQVSDELDSRAIDPDGSLRSLHRRDLTLDSAIHENLYSRFYLGAHWVFDGTRGKTIGEQIAERLFDGDVLGCSSARASNESKEGTSLEAKSPA